MAFVITGTGTREAVAYDGDPNEAAILHIEVEETAPTNQAPVASAGSDQEITDHHLRAGGRDVGGGAVGRTRRAELVQLRGGLRVEDDPRSNREHPRGAERIGAAVVHCHRRARTCLVGEICVRAFVGNCPKRRAGLPIEAEDPLGRFFLHVVHDVETAGGDCRTGVAGADRHRPAQGDGFPGEFLEDSGFTPDPVPPHSAPLRPVQSLR